MAYRWPTTDQGRDNGHPKDLSPQKATTMQGELPESWTTLNVAKYFNARGSYPQNLRIRRQTRTPILYAEWLPDPNDDPRPFEGRCNGGKGKRLTIRVSTGTEDPYAAAKRAVTLVQEHLDKSRVQQNQHKEDERYALSHYWDQWFESESERRQHLRNFKRWQREERLKWEAKDYGISTQPWAQGSVDRITSKDFKEYFDLIEIRSRTNNDTNGSGMKGQQKTLINKLLALASHDFPGHAFPQFPKISKQTRQVTHLTKDQWDTLVQTVVDLSKGVARETISLKEYEKLSWTNQTRNNHRNWVDLYDALLLEWFFYLRAEDMYRLRSEWFRDQGDGTVICNLETTKKDRPIHQTTHYRPDGYRFWKRMATRRPKGYLVLPHLERPPGNPADSHVLGTLNHLLKFAIEQCLPEFPETERKWTTIRHTAFRLTLEEDPSLAIPPKINSFADNGHTSPQQLRGTYLRFIDAERTARETRETISEGMWTMAKHADIR